MVDLPPAVSVVRLYKARVYDGDDDDDGEPLLDSLHDPMLCSDSFRRLLKMHLFTVYATHTAQ